MDFVSKNYDFLDVQLCNDFFSGKLVYKKYIRHQKYQSENIISIVSLSNSVIQIGKDWIRHIPFSQHISAESQLSDNDTFVAISALFSQIFSFCAIKKNFNNIDILKPKNFELLNTKSIIKQYIANSHPPGSAMKDHKLNFGGSLKIEKEKYSFDFSSRVLAGLISLTSTTKPNKLIAKPQSSDKVLIVPLNPLAPFDSKERKPENSNHTASLKFNKRKNSFELHDKLLYERNFKKPARNHSRPASRTTKVQACRYNVGHSDTLPLAKNHDYWDQFASGLDMVIQEDFISVALDVFKASRSSGQPLPPEVDLTISHLHLCYNMAKILNSYSVQQFIQADFSGKALYNIALWVLGSRVTKLSDVIYERFLSESSASSSIEHVLNQVKNGKKFTRIWTKFMPIDRLCNIKLDLNRALDCFEDDEIEALRKTIFTLDDNF